MNTRIVTGVLVLAVAAVAVVGASRWFAPEEREVTCSSEKAYELYREGLDQMGRFRFDRAETALVEATELEPGFAVAQIHLATVYRNMGNMAKADSLVNLAEENLDDESELEKLWVERVHAIYHDEHEKGMELQKKMVELHPEHPWVLRLRAEEARRQQDYREAIALYDRILEQDPEAIEIHNLKGYMYISLGEYDEAVHALQRYAYYAPDNANPHDSLGEAYLYQGQYEEAIREFVKALEIEPTFIWSAVHLAQALTITGQFERAEETLQEMKPIFVERGQESWMSLEQLRIDFVAERWSEMIQQAEAALPFDDDLKHEIEYAIFVHYARTAGYLELGEMDNAYAARADLEALIEEISEKQTVYGIWDSAIARNQAYLESRFGRAEGNPERGIEDLRKVVAKSRLSPHELVMYRRELAEALLAAERPDEAAEVATAVLEKIPTAPTMNLLAAKAYYRMGEREEALGYLRTHLEVMRFADAGHPQVEEATQLLQQMVPRS